MKTERVYRDITGQPCSLLWLVKHEPEWAENQIQHRDKLDSELQSAKARIEALESFAKSCANNWDCDEEGHRYGTECRACEAKLILESTKAKVNQ